MIQNIRYIPSPHFDERLLPLDMLLIHYTDMPSAEAALTWLADPRSQVSAHYLIDEQGSIYHLVEEDKRAWHAGQSFWQGCTDINSCSIGIELANPGHTHGYLPFPSAQIDALLALSQEIQARWEIPASRILAHSDVAPGRKQDPGHLFPWKPLALKGFGVWPEPVISEEEVDLTQALSQIGYDVTSLPHALLAFQRHFQPHKVDGVVDEETASLVRGLIERSV